jgi:asparaginyl-tRNA synthetase
MDLGTEHERYLSEVHSKGPIYVFDYPAEIKAFYMLLNKDEKTVSGFDLLVPGIGELIGGSARENDYEKLIKKVGDNKELLEELK